MAGIMFGLQLVILSTNYLGWVLGLGDWVSWNAASNLTPTVWLFLLVIFLFAIARAAEGDGEGGFAKHLLGG
jgi:4-hydroxybenzoate polyprenyltransferase